MDEGATFNKHDHADVEYVLGSTVCINLQATDFKNMVIFWLGNKNDDGLTVFLLI